MNTFLKAGVVSTSIAVATMMTIPTASAGGMWDGSRGSVKDAPVMQHTSAGRCYLRGDVGYSASDDPNVTLDSPRYGVVENSDEEIDGAFMGEIGIGCGSGSRGFRADFTLGYRGGRDIDGSKTDIPGTHFPGTFETRVSSLTAMANLYYDLGKFRNFVPYVGVGLGVARHKLSDVSFDLQNPDPLGPPANPVNNLSGDTQTNFAWALMAGFGYQISNRTVLDFGYRYIDMGDVETKRGDMCLTCHVGGSRDRMKIEDMHAHEFKVGLRFHFGGHRAAPAVYK